MMDNISAIIFVNKEVEQGMASVESIRIFNDIENLSVIVVDNTEGGSLYQWAQQQSDITYVYMDEGPQTFSEVFNSVTSELNIDTDILLIQEGMTITPHCISAMKAVLDTNANIGAVGGMSNGFWGDQNRNDLQSYQQTISVANSLKKAGKKRRTLNLHSAAVLWRKDTWKALGAMDEKIKELDAAMLDYCIRATVNNWDLVICSDCLWWDMQGKRTGAPGTLETARLEEKWGMHYFNWLPNYSLIEMIDKEKQQTFDVLEVGCDCGATLLEIINDYPNARVYGSELNENAAKIAAHIAKVQVDNIEDYKLCFDGVKFDYIIFGDVLEHLKNPQATIKFCKKMLKENGCIIACIPNLMHVSVMRDLINGKFEYTETGLLDKTHIHFFTYYEIVKMFHKEGYELELVCSREIPISQDDKNLIEKLVALSSSTQKFMYQTFQYVVRARTMVRN